MYPYRLIVNLEVRDGQSTERVMISSSVGDQNPTIRRNYRLIVDPTQEWTLRNRRLLTLGEEKDFETRRKLQSLMYRSGQCFQRTRILIEYSSRWLSKHEKTLSSEKGVRVGLLVFRTSSTADEATKSLSMSSDLQVSRGKRMVHSSLEEILKDFNNAYYSDCIDEDVWSQPLNGSSNRSRFKVEVMCDVKKNGNMNDG